MSSAPSEATTMRARYREQQHHENAYDVQFRAGVKGALIYTVIAALGCTAAHYTFPLFRRQTLALKGFITSSATIAGLIFGAEGELADYETKTRARENDIRRLARADLAQRGILASETAIRKWRDEYNARMEEAEALKAKAAKEATTEVQKALDEAKSA